MVAFRRPTIIAFGGKAKHGKTSLSRDLQRSLQEAGVSCEITSFASVPKRMLAVMGLTDEQLYGSEKEKATSALAGNTPRFAMQSLATEWGRRMLYEEIWVDAWQRDAEKRDVNVVIVDDLRHVPELKRLRELNAMIFEVYRPGIMPTTKWGWIKHWFSQIGVHSSERLDFKKHGVNRIIVEEGQADKTLQKILAIIRPVQ